MDGKGRAFDNIFSEPIWRTVKVEEVYLRDYQTVSEAKYYLDRYFRFYNNERMHDTLGYRNPAEVYFAAVGNISIGIITIDIYTPPYDIYTGKCSCNRPYKFFDL